MAIDGTLGNDILLGTPLPDEILADAGDDIVKGGAGADIIFGHDGDDIIDGEDGDDELHGDGSACEDGSDDVDRTPVTTFNIGTIPSTGQSLSISLTAPDESCQTSENVYGFVSQTGLQQVVNIAFVLDISESTVPDAIGGAFPLPDVNGDGFADTILDAEIAAFEALVNSMIATPELSNANVALIPFQTTATTALQTTASADIDNDGIPDLTEAARALRASGGTDFESGLQQAETFFLGAPAGTDILFFISDGQDFSPTFNDEVQRLLAAGVDIRAFGVGQNANAPQLDLVDDGLLNSSQTIVLDPSQLSDALIDIALDPADIARVELLVDGAVVATLLPGQLTATPFGLRYDATLTGLSVGADETVTARVIATDGASTTVSTTQVLEGDCGDDCCGEPGDDMIRGGAGNDTIYGNGGDDIIDGEDGDDVIYGDDDWRAVTDNADRTPITTFNVGTIPSTGQGLSISLTAPDESCQTSEDVHGFVSRGPVGSVQDILFVIDTSGSTNATFVGQSTVGDLNGDGLSNTILDAEIAGFEALLDEIISAGESNARIGVAEFYDIGRMVIDTTATADVDSNGVYDVVDALRSLLYGGNTNFEAGLQQAETFFAGTAAGAGTLLLVDSVSTTRRPPTRPIMPTRCSGFWPPASTSAPSASARMPAHRSSTSSMTGCRTIPRPSCSIPASCRPH
ncbi:MAG: VWA domain-containing protein [Zhengella sp.]|uniref:VWA domain-containing protein n=1 Tax=Zhengella sp. TaxID=2282762 RepID=UPI00352834B6